jgi:hypothetical protein
VLYEKTITRAMFERSSELLGRGSAQGAQVFAASARQGLSVPQHSAEAKGLDAMAGG